LHVRAQVVHISRVFRTTLAEMNTFVVINVRDHKCTNNSEVEQREQPAVTEEWGVAAASIPAAPTHSQEQGQRMLMSMNTTPATTVVIVAVMGTWRYMTAMGDRYTLGVSENSGQGVAYNSRESTTATKPAEKKAKLMKMHTPAVYARHWAVIP